MTGPVTLPEATTQDLRVIAARFRHSATGMCDTLLQAADTIDGLRSKVDYHDRWYAAVIQALEGLPDNTAPDAIKVLRDRCDRYKRALERIRDYEDEFGALSPDDVMRDIARAALAQEGDS